MRLAELVEKFLADRAERTKPATVKAYRGRFSSLLKQFGARELKSLEEDEVREYFAAESRFPDGGEKAPDTIRLTMVAFDQLQKFAVEKKHLKRLIIEKLRKPGGRRRELLPTPAETAQLLAQAPADFQLMYKALRLCGARPGELCRARIEDIDPRSEEIVLAEHKTARKTGRARRIAIGHPSFKAILQQAVGGRASGPIFLRAGGKPWTADYLSRIYRTARKRAGLPEGLVLYLSRHEFATQVYRATKDLLATARALGHAQTATTERYTRVDGEQLKAIQRLFDDALPAVPPPAAANPEPPAKAA